MEAKEDIRSRLNIEDVVGEYVQLKRAGRNFKGMSPFSQEKTASFMVSPEKHIWHDFSSGKGGDVFAFIMEVEGLDFKGAIELLARKAGVDLSQYRTGDTGLGKKKERLFAASDLAARFYQQSLVKNKTALEYVVKKRRMNKQVVQDFRIGYSPNDQDSLLKALVKRDFTEHELRDSGLVVTRRYGPSDMFRSRIMVPLMDPQGRVVGFTARILADVPGAPKYINTPQTLLYDKGRHVFGLHLAKEAIRQSDSAVVVEGNLDVIASHQVGIKNVVATAGTAITEHHLRALSRFTQDVRLAFDADKAGVNATERAIAIASNMGINLSIVVLPPESGAKDADELIQKDPALWQAAIDHPLDAVEWLLKTYAGRFDLTTAEGKRRATDQALGVVRAIEDPVLREHYMQKIATAVGSSLTALNSKLDQQPERQVHHAGQKTTNVQPGHDPNSYQDHLLGLAWVYPQARDALVSVEPQMFAGDARQAIAAAIKDTSRGAVSTNSLQSDDIRVKIGELELIVETKYPTFADAHYFEAVDIVKRIKKEHKMGERILLATQFNQAEDKAERVRLNKLIKQLDKDIEALKH